MTSVGHDLDRAIASRDWSAALPLLNTWTADRPDDANAWFWTAYCLDRLGRLDEARSAVKRASALNPNDHRASKLMARIDRPEPAEIPADPDYDDGGAPATEASPDCSPPATETGSGGPTFRTSTIASALWRSGDVVDGRYEVREIRRGGMGEVYFVFDRALALGLAVKTPLPKTLATSNGRLRFLREAEAWIGLGLHANICAAYYVRELGGIARLFIELIDGHGLDHWLKRDRTRGMSQRLDVAIQVASGMLHAHTFGWVDDAGVQHQGLAHRDLKPANILIGSDGIAKVTDFGLVGKGFATEDFIQPDVDELAIQIPSDDGIWQTVTVGGGVMGTPPYMPPEQWDSGHAAGKPADVYAFGCVLFEIFCGRRPFVLSDTDRKAHVEVQLGLLEDMHRKSKPPAPEIFGDHINQSLSALMLQCLEKEPAERPASFAEIRQRLVDVFAEITARPYPRLNPKARQLLGDALNNQGMSYATLGHDKRAEQAWEEALAKDPRHLEATFNLALFRWQSRGAGNSETLARMEETLKSDAPPWRARHLAGKLCLAVGDRTKALDHLKAAYLVSDGPPEVARDYAMALCSQLESPNQITNFQEAVNVLARCGGPLRFDPVLLTTYALAMKNLGHDRQSAGLYKEARRHDTSLPEDLEGGGRRLIPGFSLVRHLEGFSGRVLKLATEATGRRAASVLNDGGICIWDSAEGAIERMVRPSGDRTRCLTLSPDGAQLLATAEGDPVTIWDADTATAHQRLQAHAGFLNALQLTEDSRRVVGVGTTGTVNVWDFESRSLIGVYSIHSGFLTCLALSADCKTVVTGGSGGRVLAVDLDDGEVVTRPERHQVEVTFVAISRGGKVAASGDESGEILIWDLPEGHQRQIFRGHLGAIRFLAIDDAASTCLSVDSKGSLRLWDLGSGRLLASLSVAGEVRGGAAARDWSTVLISHGSAGLTQFDFSTIPQPVLTWAVASPVTVGEADKRAKRFAAHLAGARSLLAEGDTVSAIAEIDLARSISGYNRIEEALNLAAEAGAAFPRNGLKGAWVEEVFTPHRGKINCIRVSPSGNAVLSVGADRQVLVGNMLDGKILRSLEPIETPELAAAFFSGDYQCVTGGLDNVIHLWDFSGKTTVRTFGGHQAQINDLASAGSLILSGSSDQTARVWDTHTGVCLQVFDGHSREVMAVAFAPDARMCASSGEDELLLWDPLTGRDILALVGHDQPPSAIAWSDDGRNLLSGGRDQQLRLWDVTNGHCLRTVDVDQAVVSLALSPDDRFALTGGLEGSVQLWDIRSRQCLRTFEGHVGCVSSVAFSIDGQRGLSAGEDGTLHLWYLDWNTTPEPETGWSEQARPYLEIFLARLARGSEGPRWKDEDFRNLLDDLARRRLGRLNPDEVRRNLDRMAEEWSDPSATVAFKTRVSRRQRPGSATRRKAARRTLFRRSAISVALLMLILIIGRVLSSRQLSIDPERIDAVQQAAIAARIPYGIAVDPAPDCDPQDYREYLETFSGGRADPVEIDTAARCLGRLQDSRAVVPLLDLLRPRDPTDLTDFPGVLYNLPANRGYVLSILVVIGDDGCRDLGQALVDEIPAVRRTAAAALAAIGSNRAISTLVASAEDREPVVRIAVSRTLEAIATSGVLTTDRTFKLFKRMALDTFPEVRINVATSLRVFKGSQPRRLLEEMKQDPDANVRIAAEKSLAGL